LKHETAIDLARKWDKLVVSVKYSLMGWKWNLCPILLANLNHGFPTYIT
jgi:hypothetical protein